jgi:hypothetical protein
MKAAGIVITCCVSHLILVGAQAKFPAPEPTELEKFIGSSASHIVSSRGVGGIEGGTARLIATAIIAENTVEPPHRMAGIRIGLLNRDQGDHIYMTEQELEVARKGLEKIDQDMVRFRNGPADTPMRCLGAAEFWHPDQMIHTLDASYCITSESEGLYVSANKNQTFRFMGQTALRLATLLAQAQNVLHDMTR